MKKFWIIGLIIMCFAFKPVEPGDSTMCHQKNTSFKAGEEFELTVYYSVAGIYVNAGNATVKTTLTHLNNRPVYHVTALGNSNSSYDWIFKVRDVYESYIDTATMQPLKFVRKIREGSYKRNENIAFNKQTNTAVTNKGVFKVPDCVQDVVSSVFAARSIDFSSYSVGDKIPFEMFLSNELYHLYIRYLGKEKIKTRFGTFNAIKFKPLLIKGEMFKGGEKMTVWVSDDANHIPLRVQSPIVVGSVKVDLTGYKNLRYPLSAQIKD